MVRVPRRLLLAALATLCVPAAFSATAASTDEDFGAPYGGFAAYHGTRVSHDLKTPPQNHAAHYEGRKLVLAQSYVKHGSAEPTVGVDPAGTVFTVASAFDVLPSNPVTSVPKTMVERSTDGGRSWQVTQPAVAGQNTQPATLDPYIYVDPVTGRVFDIDLQGWGAHLSYSDDKGETWTESVLTSAGADDHQTLVSGILPEGVQIPLTDPKFQRVLYYCVNSVGYGACSRSFDGGRTFVQGNQTGYEAVNPGYAAGLDDSHSDGVCGSLHGHAVTDRGGRLFIPRGYCGIPMIAISNDAGTTFHDVKVADIAMSGEQASVGADSAGNLYYTFQDSTSNLPFLTVSRDHGEHWSTPLMVAPPGVHETNFPTVDAGDPGKIALYFPGTTADDKKDAARPWNSYVVVSTNALSKSPLFLSNIANKRNDPVHRGNCNGRCGNMFDFLDVVVAPHDHGRIWASAVDTCTKVSSCSTQDKKGENGSGHGASGDAQGVVIRELSGPALRGSGWISKDAAR